MCIFLWGSSSRTCNRQYTSIRRNNTFHSWKKKKQFFERILSNWSSEFNTYYSTNITPPSSMSLLVHDVRCHWLSYGRTDATKASAKPESQIEKSNSLETTSSTCCTYKRSGIRPTERYTKTSVGPPKRATSLNPEIKNNTTIRSSFWCAALKSLGPFWTFFFWPSSAFPTTVS